MADPVDPSLLLLWFHLTRPPAPAMGLPRQRGLGSVRVCLCVWATVCIRSPAFNCGGVVNTVTVSSGFQGDGLSDQRPLVVSSQNESC